MKDLEKNMPDTDSLRENHNKLIRNNRLILKSRSFRFEKHYVFSKEVKKLGIKC